MNLNRIPVFLGAGCLSMLLSVSLAGAQAGQSGASAGAESSPGAAGARDTSGTSGGMPDKKFVKEAMQGSMAEIKLGQLAQQKAASDDVKQFGQRMVDDHTRLSEQMEPIARQLGLTPPSDLSAKDKALESKLQGLSGAEFDKAYMKAMVKDHRKDLSEFEKEATSAKSPALKDAALQGSQVISQHLQMAQQVAQKVGVHEGSGATGVSDSTGSAIGGGMGADRPSSTGSTGRGAGSGNTGSNPR